MENLNSVCFVSKIKEIIPIEEADKIESAILNGWKCIVKKGEYKVGDMVLCAITDAVIPETLSESLGIKNYLRSGSRVRTVKLKGAYSECLIIPLSAIEENERSKLFEGKDMMNLTGIVKYEPPVKMINLSGGRKIKYRDNINFGVYYKSPNLKNIPNLFDNDTKVQITRKIHGTNARYGIVKKNKLSILDYIKRFFGNKFIEYDFVVGSHNVEKGSNTQGFYDKNVWFDIESKYDIKNKLISFLNNNLKLSNFRLSDFIGNGIIIYGEIYGAGIQKNYDYGLNEIDFVAFDISVDGKYMPCAFVYYTCLDLNIPHVEILYQGPYSDRIKDSFLLNNYIGNTKVPHEGIFIKHLSGDRSKTAKVINPEYLIYGEKNNVGDSH